MNIIYRISDSGYSKIKPNYITNENCLKNAVHVFKDVNWYVIADNVSSLTANMITKYVEQSKVDFIYEGNGARTFNIALDYALTLEEEEVVYFLENDYLHKNDAQKVLKEGIQTGADFVSLYDHPDKYMNGANPFVEEGGEVTRVILTDTCHWKLTNSTTMTFAGKVRNIKLHESVFREYTNTSHPHDFDMWIHLRQKGVGLITPIPGFSTHGESEWLSPLTDWSEYVNSNT